MPLPANRMYTTAWMYKIRHWCGLLNLFLFYIFKFSFLVIWDIDRMVSMISACLPCVNNKSSIPDSDLDGDGDENRLSPMIIDDDSLRANSNTILQQIISVISPSIIDHKSDSASINVSSLVRKTRKEDTASDPVITRLKSMTHTEPGLQWTESRKLLEAAIAIEQIDSSNSGYSENGHLSMHRQDIISQESRLAHRLYRLGLHMEVQAGDGNCQFRSLSWALFGTPKHYSRIRKTAIDYMQRNRNYFQAFLGEEFRVYVQMMSHDQVWGDELTLRAICEAFGICINVITSEHDNWFLRYIPQHKVVQREAFLCYISPVHYNAVKRRPRGAAPMLRSLSSLGRKNSRILKALDSYEKNKTIPETPQQLVVQE